MKVIRCKTSAAYPRGSTCFTFIYSDHEQWLWQQAVIIVYASADLQLGRYIFAVLKQAVWLYLLLVNQHFQ